MDQQNIDRLFREKLGLLEETPAKGSWAKVEKQIGPKKTPVIYWVAASVSLFIISWFVWPTSQTESFTPIAGEVSHPIYEGDPEFVIPVIAKKDVVKEPKPRKAEVKPKSTPKAQFASNVPIKHSDVTEEIPIMEVESKTVISKVDLEEPEINDKIIEQVNKPDFRSVKITYIASAESSKPNIQQAQKADSISTLKKFIAFAEKIDPGDVLADIKTAKDNLLNSGFKSKKDRNSL